MSCQSINKMSHDLAYEQAHLTHKTAMRDLPRTAFTRPFIIRLVFLIFGLKHSLNSRLEDYRLMACGVPPHNTVLQWILFSLYLVKQKYQSIVSTVCCKFNISFCGCEIVSKCVPFVGGNIEPMLLIFETVEYYISFGIFVITYIYVYNYLYIYIYIDIVESKYVFLPSVSIYLHLLNNTFMSLNICVKSNFNSQ